MPTLPYHVLDVFTDRPYAGNPLAVVLGADDLPTAALQSLAREFNLSETAFPMATDRDADYRVRIFTPTTELPFAGHPSIGTAWLLATLGRIPTGAVRQDCAAGILPLHVTADGATLTGGAATVSEPLDPAPLLAAVGLAADDLVAPVRRVGAGLEWTYLPVRDEAVGRAVPDHRALHAVSPTLGVAVVSWDRTTGRAHLRAFIEDGYEDPATGSAALGLGIVLAASGLVGDGDTDYEIAQGAEIGRPSTLHCSVLAAGGVVSRVTVRGGVVSVATGEITIPPG